MPSGNCAACAGNIQIDAFAMPYIGDLVCSRCGTVLFVQLSVPGGAIVQRKNPPLDNLKPVWSSLADLERQSLHGEGPLRHKPPPTTPALAGEP